jgi:hypothetical protein
VITSVTLGHIHWNVPLARPLNHHSGSKGALAMHGTSYTQILALDLGKFNSIFCCFNPADSSHRFVALQTTPTAIHDLLSSFIRTPDDAAKILVVFDGPARSAAGSSTSPARWASQLPSPIPATKPGGGPRSNARPTRMTR